jgi:hexulose-6-phosphate isomerase
MPGAVDNSPLAPHPEITPYAAAYRNSQGVLADLARSAAEPNGIKLGVENCPSKFLLSPLEFARFLDEIDSAAVRAYFDIGNVIAHGFPEHWIPVLGQRLWRVHFKDIRMSPGLPPCATPLLAGDVNWPAVMSALREIGYAAWATAEVFPHYRFGGERLIHDTSTALDSILLM